MSMSETFESMSMTLRVMSMSMSDTFESIRVSNHDR